MATIDNGPIPSMIPGVRIERTEPYGSTVFDVQTSTTGLWTASDPDVLEEQLLDIVLPSLNVRYPVERSDEHPCGGRALAPRVRVSSDNIRNCTTADPASETVLLGNPGLHAATATNYDAMGERFLSGIGVISLGYFQKEITDFIAPVQFTMSSGPYNTFLATQPQQGGNATIRGGEMNWQEQFTFLPGYLAGLGLNANYTLTQSTAHVPNQDRTADFLALVPRMGNVAVSYEYGRVQTRLAWNIKSSFLDTYGTDASTDDFTKGTTQMDFSGNVDVGRGARLFFEAVNLTNQPLTRYKGIESQPIQQEYYRAWFTTGIRWAL